jgi:hypothetical protein
MKKFISVNMIVGMIMALSVAANATSDGTPQSDQGPAVVSGQQAISGQNDLRIITPDMTYRERVETQRNIKKRAAAMRNQLIQAAELEKQQQAEAIGTGTPTATQ